MGDRVAQAGGSGINRLTHCPNRPGGDRCKVEDCDRDPRGGIYFLTGWHGFMVTSAYGFVYQPNPEGSQRFGQDSYTYQVVIDQWYWFRASQDW
ncbi:hypothetical protein [Alkalinema sp. FACHB-956]|uniref:hypothetical protein n=1 Tax=Alkalinema sp. FACHB-956 TaxID=2692768 RepID=UPI001683395B|nr:hypothetical protein [Alkalinema sp. FACHB-956]MBD2327550.1 hypothetical protein [Alkalinema sp. FACHB-956]